VAAQGSNADVCCEREASIPDIYQRRRISRTAAARTNPLSLQTTNVNVHDSYISIVIVMTDSAAEHALIIYIWAGMAMNDPGVVQAPCLRNVPYAHSEKCTYFVGVLTSA